MGQGGGGGGEIYIGIFLAGVPYTSTSITWEYLQYSRGGGGYSFIYCRITLEKLIPK
jgi:hypothetical protein